MAGEIEQGSFIQPPGQTQRGHGRLAFRDVLKFALFRHDRLPRFPQSISGIAIVFRWISFLKAFHGDWEFNERRKRTILSLLGPNGIEGG